MSPDRSLVLDHTWEAEVDIHCGSPLQVSSRSDYEARAAAEALVVVARGLVEVSQECRCWLEGSCYDPIVEERCLNRSPQNK